MSGLEIWTVYNHPKDYPDNFVARKFIGETATNEVIIEDELETLRDRLTAMGLVKLMRMQGDDLVIVETWL